MKEILFVRASTGLFGGIETQILNIASGLAKRSDLRPVLVTSTGDIPLAHRFSELGFEVEQIRFKPKATILDSTRDLRAVVQRRQPAIVQAHMLRESLTARFACLGTSSINLFRIHTYIDCSLIPEYQKTSYHILDGLTQGLVDRYVSISEDVIKELVERSFIRRQAAIMVPDGVHGWNTPADFATPFPLPRHIGMVANLVEVKGHKILIDALAILKQQGLELKADLFGIDPEGTPGQTSGYQAKLLSRAQNAGVADMICFRGWANDPWPPLENVPVIVLPSAVEGTPNGLLEAMGRCKIVVGTDIGGTSEFLKHHRTGWIHQARNPEALASSLAEVYASSAETLTDIRREAWQTWNNYYSIEACLNGLMAVYRDVAPGLFGDETNR